MGGIRGMMVALVAVAAVVLGGLGGGGKWVAAQVHHVVGGDRGWDPNSDILSWSSGRVFRVGDHIWFTYSVAQGLIAELKSREEYESCDVRNPIKMYTEGLHTIPLDKEGIRYFVSTQSQNCNSGLKLHVEVLPKESPLPITNSSSITTTTTTVMAAAPSTPKPSGSPRYGHSIILMLMAMFTMILAY